MKILLAIDGSPCSNAALEEVCRRPWPALSEVSVVHVIHASVPAIPDPFFVGYAAHFSQLEEETKLAPGRVEGAIKRIKETNPDLRLKSEILEGPPKQRIVEEAEKWRADLIVLGCHGYGPVKRFALGSVSQAVALHAPCSVEIVRSKH